MSEISLTSEQSEDAPFVHYTSHPQILYSHAGITERDNGAMSFLQESLDDCTNGNEVLVRDQKDQSLRLATVHLPSGDIFYNGSCGADSVAPSGSVSSMNGTPQCLEDYKCPICLDTFINTVKVDCSYGHKFCNFCIQCWINFERHLVTECPVCRGPIFGKRLDLKTDAEIRSIYDSLPEEDKRARLLSIKERLQLEYPNSNNPPLQAPDFQYPMHVSDPSHHQFNHDLHNPIPLVGDMERTQFANISLAENGFSQSYTETSWPPDWSQGTYYPYSPLYHYQDLQNTNQAQSQSEFEIQSTDSTDVHVHHQHYHHQSQENSRWDTNLYLTQEDTTTSPSSRSPNIRMHAVSGPPHAQILDQREMRERMDAYRGTGTDDTSSQSLPNNFPHEPMPNFSAPRNPIREYQLQDQHYPLSYSTHSHFHHLATPPRLAAQQTPLHGYYNCFTPNCPGHHFNNPSSASQYISLNGYHGPTQHNSLNSMPNGRSSSIHGQSHVIGNVTTAIGNIGPTLHTPSQIRVRPNMPGASSTSIQLPSPNNSPSGMPRSPGGNYRRSLGHVVSPPGVHFSRIRQPVSRCPARNARAHFSGGFSLFTSGYMGFQVSHFPTTMMVGDRYVSSPPARLTHPLVSLIPLNQDGSSTRVCLTFEVHRV